MSTWTEFDLNAYNARQATAKHRDKPTVGEPVKLESDLHDQILDFCSKQWPKWKCIHARMDKKSTIEKGCQDFTIFMFGKKTLCVECKKKGGKPDEDQRNWAFEMKMLGHTVYCVYNFEEFLQVVQNETNHHDNITSQHSPESHHVRD